MISATATATVHPKQPIRCKSTGLSSARYGVCEVCREHVSDVWIGTADDGRTHVFGHEHCIRREIDLTIDGAIPGSLKPRAISVISILFEAKDRSMRAWNIARHMGEESLHTLPLLHDMKALGLVESVGRQIGYQSSWRLCVAGPTARSAS